MLTVALLSFMIDAEDGLRPSVIRLKDLDGDGCAELVVGARPKIDGRRLPGRVHLLSGRNGQELGRLELDHPGFGHALAATGDLDDDGAPDFIVSSHHESGVGYVHLVSGRTLSVLESWTIGSSGFGCALAAGADLNADGCGEILVGAAGHVLVYDGRTREVLRALTRDDEGLRSWSARELDVSDLQPADGLAWEAFGRTVAFLPDLDGDGVAELSIGVGCGLSMYRNDGRTWVISSGGYRRLAVLEAPGWCVATVGDVDGDGFVDFATSTDSGNVRIWSSVTLKHLREVNTRMGGYLYGEGTSLDAIGDLDGDGIPDLVVGANESWGDTDAGSVHVYSSKTGERIRSHDLRAFVRRRFTDEELVVSARDKLDLPFVSPDEHVEIPWSGADACAAGDVNGDGLEDVFVHVPCMEEVWMLSGESFRPLWGRSLFKLKDPEPDLEIPGD